MIVVRRETVFGSVLIIEVHTSNRVAVLLQSDQTPTRFECTEWLSPREGSLLIDRFPSAELIDEADYDDREASTTTMVVSDADLLVINLMTEVERSKR